MAIENKYKQVSRQTRNLIQEKAPLNGMHYTNTPLNEGFGKILINFEKNADDTGLVPRKGATILNTYACASDVTAHAKHMYFCDTLYKYNNIKNKVCPLIRFVIDNELYYAWQGNNEQDRITAFSPVSLITNEHKPVIINNRLVCCTGFETRDLIYTAKKEASNTEPASYMLCRAEAKIETSDNAEVSQIVPKQLNPTEAANWGFNMLAANPYAFESTNNDVAGSVIFQGFLPYNNSNELVLNPICNNTEPYIFKLYTKTGVGDYAIRIRWRGVTNDVWESITPETGTLTKDKSIVYGLDQTSLKNYNIKYNPKQIATVIQIKIYSKANDAKELNNVYIDSKYNLKNGKRPTEDTDVNNIYAYDVTARSMIYKHNDKYGNTYYYEIIGSDVNSSWAYTAYPSSEDDAEEEIFEKGYRHLSTNAMSFNFIKSTESNAIQAKNFDIATAKGLCYWRNRAVAWGVTNALSTLFISDLNDPSYFPYPNNINIFSESIMHVLPFQDDLLIFTNSQIWRLKLNNDGMSWTQTCIQKNLRLDEKDMSLTLALSSMVFFKSGSFYYLLVPSSKGTGDLVLAAISRNMEDLFKDPMQYIIKVIGALYRDEVYANNTVLKFQYPTELIESGKTAEDYPLYFTHTYLDYDKIHIVYSSQAFIESDTQSFNSVFNLVLTYDTALRSWVTWIFESPQVPRLIERDSIQQGTWACLTRTKVEYIANTDKNLIQNITLKNTIDQKDYSVNYKMQLICTDTNYTVEKELVSDMQTFSFKNDIDHRDMLKRYDTQGNSVYHLTWAVYSGNEINKTNQIIAPSPLESSSNNIQNRYGVIVLGNPVILKKTYRPVPGDGSEKTEIFINYTAEPQTYYGLKIPATSEPLRFYEDKAGNNVFKDSTNTIVPDSFSKLEKTEQYLSSPIRIDNTSSYDIPIHIWINNIAHQGHIDTVNIESNPNLEINDSFFFKNYQYLDSGNRNIAPELHKKFREYQIDINNKSNAALKFYTEFLTDKRITPLLYGGYLEYNSIKTLEKNEEGVIIREDTSSFKTVNVDYDLNKSTIIPGTVHELNPDGLYFTIDKNYWNKPFITKIRIPLSIKGYLGNLKILSKNQTHYELLTTTIVYRYQNAR